MVGSPLLALIVDDSPEDAELLARELRGAFNSVEVEHVYTQAALEASLRLGRWDIVLSAYDMVGLSGLQALAIVKRTDPDLPFILVTGVLGEERAVETLKAGVDDYILKDSIGSNLKETVVGQVAEAAARRKRRRSTDALQESEQRFRQLAENIDVFFYLTDLDNSRIYYASPAYQSIWGRSLDTLYADPKSWLPAVHPEDRDASVAQVGLAAKGDVEKQYRVVRPDGAIRWVRSRRFSIRDHTGEPYRIAGIIEDITERKETQERLRRLNRVHAVLSGINSLIVRVPDREELYREACRIAVEVGQLRFAWLGIYDRTEMAVRPVAQHGSGEGLLSLMRLSIQDAAREGRGLVRRAIREGRPVVVNDIEHDTVFILRHEALARGLHSAATLPLMIAGEPIGVIGFFAGEAHFFDEEEMRLLTNLAADISFALDHIGKSEKLTYLALYDGQTGLANRTLFLERLTQHIEAAQAARSAVAVVVADLERFRMINGSLGREAGDALLSRFAKRLAGAIDQKDEAARIGPDQFAIALTSVRNPADAARKVNFLANACFEEPFLIQGQELRVSAKAGIALFPDDGMDADALVRNAEAALKRAKSTGERNVFFEQRMTERVASNLSLENELRRAIEQNEFILHYQPRIKLNDQSVVGFEALIRWQSERGLAPPGDFIPLLEETGLIVDVGAWALREVVLQHKTWTDAGIPAPRLAVNVSAVQLREKDFVAKVVRAMEKGSVPAMIDLEITESMVMDDLEGNIAKLRAIRDLGVGIAIDDFGTGYSSLAYLARLPVTSLKIDRSFIITMLNDANAMNLVSMIVSLAHSLKLKVVAEGVDSEDQAAALRRLRCEEMQGFLFSKPLPPDGVITLLQKRR